LGKRGARGEGGEILLDKGGGVGREDHEGLSGKKKKVEG